MTKVLISALVVLGLVFAGVRYGIPYWLGGGAAQTTPSGDFTTADAWLLAPSSQPRPVWEGGWAIDFIIVPPVPHVLEKHGVVATDADPAKNVLLEQVSVLAAQLETKGPVYMPALRMPAPTSATPDWAPAKADVVNALDHYLGTWNKGRAIALVIPPGGEEVAAHAVERLEQDPAVSARLALILLDAGAETPERRSGVTEHIEFAVPRTTLVALSNPIYSLEHVGDPDRLNAAVAEAFVYLEDVPQSVEPFGGLEMIEPAPIKRPD